MTLEMRRTAVSSATTALGGRPAKRSTETLSQAWQLARSGNLARSARAKAAECIAAPERGLNPEVRHTGTYQWDGIDIEHLIWTLPYGRPTQALLLKPSGATGRLPAVLGLHDHGGMKYFGHQKIAHGDAPLHPLIIEHQANHYGGRSWANELARRGYVVLVHDAFAFASRRVQYEDMLEIPWGDARTRELSASDPESAEGIKGYNAWASAHEHVMAKSLFCGGTTWPGVFLSEDQYALDILCARGRG